MEFPSLSGNDRISIFLPADKTVGILTAFVAVNKPDCFAMEQAKTLEQKNSTVQGSIHINGTVDAYA